MNYFSRKMFKTLASSLVNSKVPMDNLKEAVVLITGVSGYIGFSLFHFLVYLNSKYNFNIKIILVVRNRGKLFSKSIDIGFDLNQKDNNIFVYESDMENLDGLDIKFSSIDYIFHLASPTQSQFFIDHPIDTVDAILTGVKSILNLAVKFNVKKVLNFSTMEIYGETDDLITPQQEKDLCYLDLYKKRNSYPLAKRMAEHYCYLYHSIYDLDVISLRLVQVLGPGVALDDQRVFAQFARAVAKKENIILNTDGQQRFSYIHISDVLESVFYILFVNKNKKDRVFNVTNSDSSSLKTIKDVAGFCVELSNNQITVQFNINEKLNEKYVSSKRILDSGKLYNLGFKPRYNMEFAMQELVEYFKVKIETK